MFTPSIGKSGCGLTIHPNLDQSHLKGSAAVMWPVAPNLDHADQTEAAGIILPTPNFLKLGMLCSLLKIIIIIEHKDNHYGHLLSPSHD